MLTIMVDTIVSIPYRLATNMRFCYSHGARHSVSIPYRLATNPCLMKGCISMETSFNSL